MNFDQARFNMVEQQIRPWEVLDSRVLSLLETIHREDFVPVRYRKLAFADIAVPLECDQVMMRPKIEARMLQALDLKEDETVLEIGTGSGFITACLAALSKRVVSVELFDALHREAAMKLKDKEIGNAELFVGDVINGWQPEQAHDVVVVTGSVPAVPEQFKGWVNPGGRMFVITGESPAMEARLLTRLDVAQWSEESLFETDLPRLVNAEPPPAFEF
ncbi:MAG: protein-L-isoaspartate O-methyltransferase [Xanthomonadales bacterium]|nr:protein-L-isoaspartate O-methyltransferase [Gammaproteobacteria bacterium]MBT8053021.1 protein-L-isoaspartate O-methyltransferase [Gammaproteobacteria bacterium]NND57913.1 protein-L-isoaspartate O-methyltransferase [Xanthomonadales bacterium]NNK50793.1 protein-L-isoaspartate O-methyltransferase [Xanthomonadales bacterium]